MSCRVLCTSCRKLLYIYEGTFEGVFRAQDFKPIGDAVVPGPGVEMLCPRCLRPFYMVRSNGALVLMTSEGWKPCVPKGKRTVPLPGSAAAETMSRAFDDPDYAEGK